MKKKYIKPYMKIVELHSRLHVLNVVSGGKRFYKDEEVDPENAI